MKKGKFIPVGTYNNVKIGYGTVDHKNLKTVYIQLNAWVQPTDNDTDYDRVIQKTRRQIKHHILSLRSDLFKPESIVDLDIKTNSITLSKRSFMDLEITLFVNRHFDVRANEVKSYINGLCEDVIDTFLIDETLYNFYLTKN